jgi:hypothetical protein
MENENYGIAFGSDSNRRAATPQFSIFNFQFRRLFPMEKSCSL